MRIRRIRTLFVLWAVTATSAFPQARVTAEPPPPDYSILGGVLGSLGGLTAGGIVGIVAAAPAVNRCQEGSDSDTKGLCVSTGLVGMGIGASLGYSLGIPIGGHMKGGLWNRKFALNLAAMTAVTGALALVDYGLYAAYDEKSFRVSIPLSLVVPHVAAYFIGR